MEAEDLTLEHEGKIDLPELEDVTPTEAVLLRAVERVAEMQSQFALAVIISGNQLDVMTTDGASHEMLADLFQSLANSHTAYAQKPPEIITEH